MVPFRSFSFRTLFTLFAVLPMIVFAAGPTYQLIAPFGSLLQGDVSLSQYLQGIIHIVIGVAGILAVVMIVVCGIKLMMSGAASGKAAAKECIWNAIFGLLIAIGAWAILFTINPDLLRNDLNLVDIPASGSSAGTPSGGGVVAGVTVSWAAGPGCPQSPGTIATAVPTSNCPAGGTGVCCSFIAVPTSKPVANLPPPPGATPPLSTPPPAPSPIIPPPLPGLQFSTTRFGAAKTAATVLISVSRTGPTTGTVSVDYATVNGTALAGVNFTAVSGTLTFAPGVTTQTFSVPIIPTTAVVGNKQFTVQLSNPSAGVKLNAPVATVTITDPAAVTTAPSADTVPPVVQIINPANGFISSLPLIAVDFSVTENIALRSVTITVVNSGTGATVFSQTICTSFATQCPPLGLTSTAIAVLPAFIGSANLTINVKACDKSANCTTASITGQFVDSCPTGDPRCLSDALALQNCIGQAVTGACARADLNKDGVIDNADMTLLSNASTFDINRDGVIDTKTLTTNFNDTCFFHTAQDPLLPCAVRVLGNITLSAADKTALGAIYTSSQTAPDKLSLSQLDANLCAKFGCTTAGLGLGGTNQQSIYGEAMLTTFRQYDFNGDGVVDGNPVGADMSFFYACVADPASIGCIKADINLDGFVTNADLNLLFNAAWAWENKLSTLSNMERIFWSGDAQPEAGIISVCQGAQNILLCGLADLTKDGVINAADATFLQGANMYDINGDGLVVYSTPVIPTPVTGASANATSTKFIIGDLVVTTNSLIVRAAAGDASQFLGTIPTGTTGTVVGGPVFADGNWWWKIAYTGSFTGWSIEPSLKKATVAPTPPPAPPSSITSAKFAIGDRVGTTANLNVRATAGLTGTFIGMIPVNTTRGNVIGGPTLADGYWWWQVKWDSGISGWSVENYMKEFTPPPAPKITTPTNNSYMASSTVKIGGTMPSAEAGGTVSVQKGTTVLGNSIISTGGAWQTSLKFADGTYTLFAIATDQSDNVGPTSTPVTFTVDTIAPNAPTVTAPGSIVAASTVTITGTASEAGTIYVYSNSTSGTLLGTVTTSGGANAWTFSKSGYVNGAYTFAILAHDLAGNIGPVTTKTVQVAVPPAAPKITAPTSGSITNQTSVAVAGTGAVAGDTINLYSGSTLLGSTAVSSTKTWSITLSGLTDGARTVNAVEVDTTTVASAPSTNVTFTVDTVPPAAPAISAPGATVNAATFTMSGTAELLSTVYVYANSTTGTLLGTAVTNGAGSWAFTLSNYVNGTYTFAATTHDKAGNISGATPLTTVVSAPPPAPKITAPLNGAMTNQRSVSGTGLAEGNTISLYAGTTLLGTATIGAAKTWAISLPSLTDGPYTVNAIEMDTVVSVSGPASANVSFTLDTIAPIAPVITVPANGATIAGPIIVTSGTGATTGSVIKLYVGGAVMTTSSVDGAMNWNAVVAPVTPGTWTFSVTETDAAGNESAQSSPVTITVT